MSVLFLIFGVVLIGQGAAQRVTVEWLMTTNEAPDIDNLFES